MANYNVLKRKYEDTLTFISKNLEIVELLKCWNSNLKKNKKVTYYFERNRYKKIAIYGTNYFSRRLQQELQNTDISIELVFDENSIDQIKNYSVDVIVVTSLHFFYEILFELKQVSDCRIVSIGEVIHLSQ